MKQEKLINAPYAQAHIERTNNRIALISYTTKVAEIVGGVLMVYGLYSMTTRRHIGTFARQFGADFAIAKKCYTDNIGYDIITKEYVAL